MYYNLKALIKAIRATKTLADERSVIQKESAAIRTSFRDEESHLRYNNVAKMLYIHMLGHPTAFGQIECLKLVASPKFGDKKLGYLGIMLLLDESQEVLTLVTNSLKNDMNHSNMYIVGLALCTFANIASEEMSRDLVNEVQTLLGSSNSYLRKKAALCAVRVLRKVPELIDHFTARASALLADRNHGVLLCGVGLVTEMCTIDPQSAVQFRQAVPLLVRHLKALVTTGFSPEHDVSGITDPFLQVKILRLLRVLGKGDATASEAMNDILAQVATNTDGSKNVGNAILYEAVLTILEIEAESSLRVMAINILGKFLGNRDNNIRYVALNTLNKVVGLDTPAVQRHRTIILDCLRDGDVSIRRRALELSYALVNEGNVRIMIRELVGFLENCDAEFKTGLTTQVCHSAERFAPNKRWHIDTMLRVLKLAGNYVREEVLAAFIRLVTHTPELQAYTAQKLYAALRSDFSQESLTLAGVWVIGEFGEVLVQGGSYESEDVVQEIKEGDVVELMDLVLVSPYSNPMIRQFTLTALTKLSARFTALQIPRITTLLARYSNAAEVEIQQRAVEFGALLELGSGVREGVLERMPAPEVRASLMGTVSEKRAVGSTRADKDSLVDLMGDEATDETVNGRGHATGSTQPGGGPTTQDLLADIFGSPDPAASTPAPAATTLQAPPPKSAVNDIMSLFGDSTTAPALAPAAPPASSTPSLFDLETPSPAPKAIATATTTTTTSNIQSSPTSYLAYDQPGLKLEFVPTRDPSKANVLNICAKFTSSLGAQNVNFQAAVPKTQKLQMLAISNPNVSPNATETQQLRVMFPPGAHIRLRLRISYTSEGESRQDQTDFSFPASIFT